MKNTSLFILSFLLLLFSVSVNKMLLLPISLVIVLFFVYQGRPHLAIICLSILFVVSIMISKYKFEGFQNETSASSINNIPSQPTGPQSTIDTRIPSGPINVNVNHSSVPLPSGSSGVSIPAYIQNIASQASLGNVTPTNTSMNNTKPAQTAQTAQPAPTTNSVTQAASTRQTVYSQNGNVNLELTSPSLTIAAAKSNENEGPLIIESSNYAPLLQVFRALLEPKYLKKNLNYINQVIENYGITSIFDLSRKVLNIENKPMYKNFLEKITCFNGKNVNYIDCNNSNYKKLFAFSELILVFTLDQDKVFELINTHNIMSLCQLSASRSILEDFENQTSYSFELLGLQYYLNEKTFARKYYDILKLLELDSLLTNKPDEKHLSLREKLFNYHDDNKKAVKDLNTIMVLFDFYNIFDKYVLNLEDDDYRWDLGILKSVDLELPFWENVTFFSEYNVRERIVKAINRLTSVDDEFLDRADNPDNPFSAENRVINGLKDETLMYKDEEDVFGNSIRDYEQKYKTAYEKKEADNKDVRDKLNVKLNVKYIQENFSSKMIEIMNEIVQLLSRKCALDCSDSTNPLFDKFIFYITEIFKIFYKEDRMLYVGILMVILSIIFNFISSSK